MKIPFPIYFWYNFRTFLNMAKKIPTLLLLACMANTAKSQDIQEFFFNLYTDSLKIGTFNYINVDALLKNGRYLPLDQKTVLFESSAGSWEGNSLFLDTSFKADSVVVRASLKKDLQQTKTITIYIKKGESMYKVKTEKELLDELNRKKPRR